MSLVAVAIAAALSGGATAQTQTAEGAQKFLRAVVDGNNVNAFVVGRVTTVLTKTYRPTSSTEYGFWGEKTTYSQLPPEVTSVQKMYAWGAAAIGMGDTACVTRTRSRPVNPARFNYDMQSAYPAYSVVYQIVGPSTITADIDWSRAVIKRGLWASFSNPGYDDITETRFNAGEPGITVEQGSVALEYKSSDPEMIDRIEFAMKFLKASCDRTAETGF